MHMPHNKNKKVYPFILIPTIKALFKILKYFYIE